MNNFKITQRLVKKTLVSSLAALALAPSYAHHDSTSAKNAFELSSKATTESYDLSTQQGFEDAMAKIYREHPTCINLVDPKKIDEVASRVLGPIQGHQFSIIFNKQKAKFSAARNQFLKSRTIQNNGKTIVVSGLSVSGMLTAISASEAGYRVVAFEQRDKYTRNIQWTGRQSLLDTLALLDQNLADRFLKEVVGPIHAEHDLLEGHLDAVVKLDPPRRGDGTQIPTTPKEMLDGGTVMLVETKKIETFLMNYIKTLPGIELHTKEKMKVAKDDLGKFSVEGVGTPELIVIAEGSGSETRKLLEIVSTPTSPARHQIAGEVSIERNGGLTFNEQRVVYADGTRDVLLTSAISNSGAGRNWSVTDVPSDVSFEPAGSLTPGSPEYKAERQRLVEIYYRKQVAAVLQKPLHEITEGLISGPIEKMRPAEFVLQQNISSRAVFGKNMIAIGDTVGNAHWNVGGGVHVAAISHLIRFDNLLSDLENGRDRTEALAEFNKNALADSMEWGRRGITDFYPDRDPETVRRIYDLAVEHWLADPVHAPKPLEVINAKVLKAPKKSIATPEALAPICREAFSIGR